MANQDLRCYRGYVTLLFMNLGQLNFQFSPRALVSYLNDPPAETKTYRAIRHVAEYYAGDTDLDFLQTFQAVVTPSRFLYQCL